MEDKIAILHQKHFFGFTLSEKRKNLSLSNQILEYELFKIFMWEILQTH